MTGLKDTSKKGLSASSHAPLSEHVTDISQYRSRSARQPISQPNQRSISELVSPNKTSAAPHPSLTPGRITGPVQVLLRIIDAWGLSLRDATKMLGYEDTDQAYVSQILEGFTTLRGRDPKDRIRNLFIILSSLSGLFRSEVVENSWLREQQPELDNLSPFDYLIDGSMEKLLRVRQLVDAMAGK